MWNAFSAMALSDSQDEIGRLWDAYTTARYRATMTGSASDLISANTALDAYNDARNAHVYNAMGDAA